MVERCLFKIELGNEEVLTLLFSSNKMYNWAILQSNILFELVEKGENRKDKKLSRLYRWEYIEKVEIIQHNFCMSMLCTDPSVNGIC